MVSKSRLFSLDEESNGYIETIPKQARSQVVREGLKLHKFQHRDKKDVKNTEKPKAEVKIIG